MHRFEELLRAVQAVDQIGRKNQVVVAEYRLEIAGIALEKFNFPRDLVEPELGQAVVLIGPNNSGKTTALQALALWDIGLRRWNEKRGSKVSPEERPGVTINRRDLIAIPIPDANLLWRDLHVRSIAGRGTGQQKTQSGKGNFQTIFHRVLRKQEDAPKGMRQVSCNRSTHAKRQSLPGRRRPKEKSGLRRFFRRFAPFADYSE